MKTNTLPVVIFFIVVSNNGGINAAISIGELGCSFETDFCKWNIVSSTNWTRDQYRHPLFHSTGPQKAKDGAFYIHTTEFNNDDNAKVASLESEPFHTTSTSSGRICFTFWYYMFGVHIQGLTVTVGDSQKFNRTGNKGQEWHCGVIDVTGLSGKIAFNANRSELPYSIIALDYFKTVYISSETCSENDCVKSDVTSTISPPTTSGASQTSSTTEPDLSVSSASGGVIELLPIAIGVPCGVLLVGAIIVGICIHKRSHSGELVRHPERPFTEINPYGGSPRHTIIEEEVYEEIDEAAMIGNDNGGYIDAVPPSYDEIGNVELRQNGNVGYINHKSERPPSEDYLTPISAQNDQPNRPNNDYSHSETVHNRRPQSDDYLKPGEFLKDDVNL